MPYLILGLALLIAFLLAARWLADADAATIRRGLKWAGAAAVAVLVFFLAVTGKLYAAGAAAVTLLPWLFRWRNLLRMAKSPSAGQSSAVETDYLRMTLDHDTGAMTGEVVRGSFAGRRLDAMDREELLSLLGECRADPRSAAVLEAYLDRVHGADWREAEGAGEKRRAAADGPMTREEAYEILGLRPGASEEEIRDAYRRLMAKIHPDQGGSTYLASKLNQAKDVLLGH